MMLFPLNSKEYGVNYEKKQPYMELSIFKQILTSDKIESYYTKTKKWMETLYKSDCDVSDDKMALDLYLQGTKEIDDTKKLYYFNSALNISSKNFPELRELLLDRSKLLGNIKDIKANIHGLEKTNEIFEDTFRSHDMVNMYSHEAFDAMHACDLKNCVYFLQKMKYAVHVFKNELFEAMIPEWEERIKYLEGFISSFKKSDIPNGGSIKSKRHDFKNTLNKNCRLNDENHGVTSRNDIYPGTLILRETPRVTLLENKGFQCDNCHELSNLIPCFDCHCVFYCSIECEKEDKYFHKYECMGLRLKILYLIRSQMDIKNLIVAMHELNKNFLNNISDMNIKNATDFWEELIRSQHENFDTPYYNFFYQPFDFNDMTINEFDMLCTKVFQTVFYLKHYTTFFHDFFSHIKSVSLMDKEIWVSALLLRHACIQRIKLRHFSYKKINTLFGGLHYDQYTEPVDIQLIMKMQPIIKTVYDNCYQKWATVACYDSTAMEFDKKQLKIFLKKLETASKDVEIPDLQKQTYNTFLEETSKDNKYLNLVMSIAEFKEWKNPLVEVLQEFARIVKTNSTFRLNLTSVNMEFEQRIKCLYSKLLNFRHSCNPNTFFMIQGSGRVVLKASRIIKENEEITVTYGPHYLKHCRKDRHTKLSELGMDCKCMACESEIDMFERINSEVCRNCSNIICEGDKKCIKCKTPSFTTLPKTFLIQALQIYQMSIDSIDMERKYHAYVTTQNIIKKFLSSNSPILLKQSYLISRMFATSAEPLCAASFLPRMYLTAKEIYPEMSLELQEHLRIQFRMYLDILNFSYENRTQTFKNNIDMVVEMTQKGSKLCEEINNIYLAWDMETTHYYRHEFELQKKKFGEVIDKICEYARKKEEIEAKIKEKIQESEKHPLKIKNIEDENPDLSNGGTENTNFNVSDCDAKKCQGNLISDQPIKIEMNNNQSN